MLSDKEVPDAACKQDYFVPRGSAMKKSSKKSIDCTN